MTRVIMSISIIYTIYTRSCNLFTCAASAVMTAIEDLCVEETQSVDRVGDQTLITDQASSQQSSMGTNKINRRIN